MNADQKAEAATRILKDPFFQRAVEELKRETYDLFTTSTSNATVKREEMYRDIKALDRIQARLESHLNNLELLKAKKIRSI